MEKDTDQKKGKVSKTDEGNVSTLLGMLCTHCHRVQLHGWVDVNIPFKGHSGYTYHAKEL